MTGNAKSPRYVLAELLPQIRARAGDMSAQQLADRVHELGGRLDRAAISKIESKSRNVSLDEALLLAVALDVAPVHLFLPRDDAAAVALTPAMSAVNTVEAREWLRGHEQLSGLADKPYRTEVPDSEWERTRQPSPRELDAANAVERADRRVRVARKVLDMLQREISGLDDDPGALFGRWGGLPARKPGQGLLGDDTERRELKQELRTARAELAEAQVDLDDALSVQHRLRDDRNASNTTTED